MTIKMGKKSESYLIKGKEHYACSNDLFHQLLVSDNIERKKCSYPGSPRKILGWGKEGSETGCESTSTSQPKEGQAHPKWYFWQARGQKQRFRLVKSAPIFPANWHAWNADGHMADTHNSKCQHRPFGLQYSCLALPELVFEQTLRLTLSRFHQSNKVWGTS